MSEKNSNYVPGGSEEIGRNEQLKDGSLSEGKTKHSSPDDELSDKIRDQKLSDQDNAGELRDQLDLIAQKEAKANQLYSEIKSADIKTPDQARVAIAKAEEAVRMGGEVADMKAARWLEKLTLRNMVSKMFGSLKKTVFWMFGPFRQGSKKT